MAENKLKENLQSQLDELESLQSMFYNPGEIKIDDPLIINEIKLYINGNLNVLPPCLDFIINLPIEENKFELCVSLTHEYPFVEPEIFIRNSQLNKTQHIMINKEIGEFIKNQSRGEPCIFQAISWLQDNAHNYLEECKKPSSTSQKIQDTTQETLVRYWIYSHHIYSKTKRKAIIDLANQLKITGFIMPGKPGIICVEGCESDVSEWWQSIKSMNWKKIFCKITENDKEDTKTTEFLKFKNFEEKVFDNHGPKFNHMDMGELYRFLEKYDLGYIFKDIFGFDSKTA